MISPDERWEPVQRLSEHASELADEDGDTADAPTDVCLISFYLSDYYTFRRLPHSLNY